MTNDLIYNETAIFTKNLNQLKKRFKTLDEDLKVARNNTIELLYIHQIDNNSIVKLSGFPHEFICIYKIRKFACKALKGSGARSGIRVVYAYHIKNSNITFIEIYYKGDQENEDKQKINDFLKSLNSASH